MSLEYLNSLDTRVKEALAIYYFALKLGFDASKEVAVTLDRGQFVVVFKRHGRTVGIRIKGPYLSQSQFDDMKKTCQEYAQEISAKFGHVDHRVNALWETSQFKNQSKNMESLVQILLSSHLLNIGDLNVA